MHVLFDRGPLRDGTLFAEPEHVIRADDPEDIAGAFEQIEQARQDGFWLAGYASYELGYAFSSKLRDLMPPDRRVPLLHFAAFRNPVPAPPPVQTAPATLSPLVPEWGFDRYADAFDQVKSFIQAGDIYQVNLTFALTGRFSGAATDLYGALCARQQVGHGALLDLGGPVLLSRSPELFFDIDGAGRIQARPMKGTSERGATPREDARNKEWLAHSEKNRAENLMIVDLLRNDIGRIAEIGSVRVPRLFDIETYATVHQMTSQVVAQIRQDVTLPEVFRALFPCGSITGAPKIRAMQIIHALEGGPRDAYCGAIGWLAPTGEMSFNVAIRTLTLFEGGEVRMNVGGGIVHDSTAADEYQEALWKARFATLSPATSV